MVSFKDYLVRYENKLTCRKNNTKLHQQKYPTRETHCVFARWSVETKAHLLPNSQAINCLYRRCNVILAIQEKTLASIVEYTIDWTNSSRITVFHRCNTGENRLTRLIAWRDKIQPLQTFERCLFIWLLIYLSYPWLFE